MNEEEAEMSPRKAKTSLKITTDTIPPGFKLRHTLSIHKEQISQIVWSVNGLMLASTSEDQTTIIWDAVTGSVLKVFNNHGYSVAWSSDGSTIALGGIFNLILWDIRKEKQRENIKMYSQAITNMAWSPNKYILAIGESDNRIRLWDLETKERFDYLVGHNAPIGGIAWSPDGQMLASVADENIILMWDAIKGKRIRTLLEPSIKFGSIVWSPDGKILASGSSDNTIRIWETRTGRQIRILEGHTGVVTNVSFSFDGTLLASKSNDGTVRLWRSDSWETVSILNEPSSYGVHTNLAFHPNAPILATLNKNDTAIRIWDLDFATILNSKSSTSSIHYTNAKVVLVGDSGVGKSGLALALTGQPFTPTESTHGRFVRIFDNQEIELDNTHKETREILIWDLAGQPGYRLVHQLYLNELAVAIVVFDARSETDPFAGVVYWDRALKLAQRVQGNSAPNMKKILVAARTDRGGVGVSLSRIESLKEELNFDMYFETSAKAGRGIEELAKAIHLAIDWETLPRVSSTELFQQIKDFLIREKVAGRLLSTTEDIYSTFLKSSEAPTQTSELYTQFETCIGRVESRDLIRRLGFGNLVLLQPELLDSYASALVNTVKDEPDGIGSITEEKARNGQFSMPEDERIKNKELEKLLLIAMVEDLLRREITSREQADDGPYLVFPSQSTRENPDLSDPEGMEVVFEFEGPVANIYATLAVRLSHSGLFKRKDLWKNAVTYTTTASALSGTYGMLLHNIGEGHGELTLFFDKESANKETRFHFEEYIYVHLQRKALQVERKPILSCKVCGFVVTKRLIQLRTSRGFNWLNCPSCDSRVSLQIKKESATMSKPSRIQEMDRTADTQRDREADETIIQGKIETGDFDVFLCHNGEDENEVKKIGEQLKERAILPWLDVWELPPGQPWQRVLEQQITRIKSAAVFVGRKGIGPWQQIELEALLREFATRGHPVIPVLLNDAPAKPELPIFLRGITWVDFRKQESDPIERLIWGITGKK